MNGREYHGDSASDEDWTDIERRLRALAERLHHAYLEELAQRAREERSVDLMHELTGINLWGRMGSIFEGTAYGNEPVQLAGAIARAGASSWDMRKQVWVSVDAGFDAPPPLHDHQGALGRCTEELCRALTAMGITADTGSTQSQAYLCCRVRSECALVTSVAIEEKFSPSQITLAFFDRIADPRIRKGATFRFGGPKKPDRVVYLATAGVWEVAV